MYTYMEDMEVHIKLLIPRHSQLCLKRSGNVDLKKLKQVGLKTEGIVNCAWRIN